MIRKILWNATSRVTLAVTAAVVGLFLAWYFFHHDTHSLMLESPQKMMEKCLAIIDAEKSAESREPLLVEAIPILLVTHGEKLTRERLDGLRIKAWRLIALIGLSEAATNQGSLGLAEECHKHIEKLLSEVGPSERVKCGRQLALSQFRAKRTTEARATLAMAWKAAQEHKYERCELAVLVARTNCEVGNTVDFQKVLTTKLPEEVRVCCLLCLAYGEALVGNNSLASDLRQRAKACLLSLNGQKKIGAGLDLYLLVSRKIGNDDGCEELLRLSSPTDPRLREYELRYARCLCAAGKSKAAAQIAERIRREIANSGSDFSLDKLYVELLADLGDFDAAQAFAASRSTEALLLHALLSAAAATLETKQRLNDLIGNSFSRTTGMSGAEASMAELLLSLIPWLVENASVNKAAELMFSDTVVGLVRFEVNGRLIEDAIRDGNQSYAALSIATERIATWKAKWLVYASRGLLGHSTNSMPYGYPIDGKWREFDEAARVDVSMLCE